MSQRIDIPLAEFAETVKTMPCVEGECWVYPVDPAARAFVRHEDWNEVGTKPRSLRRFAYVWFTRDWPPPLWTWRSCRTRQCINPDHANGANPVSKEWRP